MKVYSSAAAALTALAIFVVPPAHHSSRPQLPAFSPPAADPMAPWTVTCVGGTPVSQGARIKAGREICRALQFDDSARDNKVLEDAGIQATSCMDNPGLPRVCQVYVPGTDKRAQLYLPQGPQPA